MRIIKTLSLITIIILLSQCRAKKITESVATKTITIEYSENYCGGAAPPADILTELAKLKPFAEREVQVFAGNPLYITPLIYKTNAKGEITLPVNLANQVFINLYQSSDDFKADSEEYECYKKFINEHLLIVDLKSPVMEFKFNTIIQCNPCIPVAP